MEKGDKLSFVEDEILQVNHLTRVLDSHIEKFEAAYVKQDSNKFNLLKREILQIQRKIHSLVNNS